MAKSTKNPFDGVANAENLSETDKQRLLNLAEKERTIELVEASNITLILIDTLTVLVGGAVGYIVVLEMLKSVVKSLI